MAISGISANNYPSTYSANAANGETTAISQFNPKKSPAESVNTTLQSEQSKSNLTRNNVVTETPVVDNTANKNDVAARVDITV